DNEGTATRPPSHAAYIPFIRRIASDPLGTGIFGIDEWQLWIAKSVNGGETWTRHHVATRPPGNNPVNIFPQLTIDRAGNLYFTWSETQGGPTESTQATRKHEERKQSIREQDVFYAFSTDGGVAWSPPINVTKETGDSAVFPWMVAGDAGRVDLVYYKANTGINSNIGFLDAEGNPCEDPNEPCGGSPNPSVWNVYFAQSLNALNTGPNFNTVQVTPQPHHLGQICTSGLACEGDRDLLDFFTVDVDSRGAALIAYSDDNRRRSSDTQDLVTRQISGASVFKNQTITLVNEWPIRNHSVTDRAGDVFDTAGLPKGSCPGMDVLATSVDRKNDLITVNLTLNGAPSAAAAAACGGVLPELTTTGGLWGAEFWAAADPASPTGPSNRFFIAYRDNPPDGPPRVEGGTMDHVNVTVTSLDFNDRTEGTLGGNCFATPTPVPCTITMTVSASSLGITPGNALNHITGLSTYLFGNLSDPVPLTRVVVGNSEQADATAPFHVLGSGTP
ncbi:MAG: glycoside hydrolase, partial [Actinomycetota bacterium]|nr:glycoside hydrolase [Actinomycetota bacterium]